MDEFRRRIRPRKGDRWTEKQMMQFGLGAFAIIFLLQYIDWMMLTFLLILVYILYKQSKQTMDIVRGATGGGSDNSDKESRVEGPASGSKGKKKRAG